MMRSLVRKLKPLKKCQFSNCSHLIASHCILYFPDFAKFRLDQGLRDNKENLEQWAGLEMNGLLNRILGRRWLPIRQPPPPFFVTFPNCKN